MRKRRPGYPKVSSLLERLNNRQPQPSSTLRDRYNRCRHLPQNQLLSQEYKRRKPPRQGLSQACTKCRQTNRQARFLQTCRRCRCSHLRASNIRLHKYCTCSKLNQPSSLDRSTGSLPTLSKEPQDPLQCRRVCMQRLRKWSTSLPGTVRSSIERSSGPHH